MVRIVQVYKRVYRNDGDAGDSEIQHGDVLLSRFMDKLYIGCTTEELDETEVWQLCRQRSQNPTLILEANSAVKGIFRQLIDAMSPRRVLEVGAGSQPVIDNANASKLGIDYLTSDSDPDVSATIKFSESHPKLELASGCIDIVAAVFVLHFRFPPAQISEIFRCLTTDGIFLANVYRRSSDSRKALELDLANSGFNVVRVADPCNLCQDHEYWIAAKSHTIAAAATRKLNSLLTSQRASL